MQRSSIPPRVLRGAILLAAAGWTSACDLEDGAPLMGPDYPSSSPRLTVASQSHLYTLDAHFEEGALLSVNHDAPNQNQLQLDSPNEPFPFVNIAASARGTMVRIDVNTGAILGEYLTAPNGRGRDPSRTTVDQLGNIWVANRAEFQGGRGSVSRIGLVIGGSRVNADGSPNASGDYLAPPFKYNTCIDRNGDNLIRTSRGLADIRPWSNPGGVDDNGGVTSAEDECIINYTRVTGTGTRTLAVDKNNDLWVGGIGDRDHEKLNGVTGQPVPGTQINYGCGGYGGLVDRNGILWSARELLRYDPSAGSGACLGNSQGDYGLGLDPKTGHIWQSSLFSAGVGGPCCRLYEFDSAGNVINSYPQPFGAQGVAVDGNSHVWVAEIFGSRVAHYAPDPANPGKHLLVGVVTGLHGVTGVAVDANGKIWAAEINSSSSHGASRINPNAGPVGAGGYHIGAVDMTVGLGAGAGPYNYSDMTGFVAVGGTSPQGSWSVVQDAGSAGMRWGTITWNKEPQGSEPAGTRIIVEARAAESESGLATQPFVPVSNGVLFDLVGRYLEVRATLKASPDGVSPVLSDIKIEVGRINVQIDIKPGGDPNSIKLNDDKGPSEIPVAILSSDGFDARQVDASTVTLGDESGTETSVTQRKNGTLMAALEDVDGDGDADMVLHFERPVLMANGDLTESTTRLVLLGSLSDGRRIRGTDAVRVIP